MTVVKAAEIQKQIDAAGPGATIQLPAARIEGQLVISKALVLKGAGLARTIIDAGGRGTALAIEAGGAGVVRVEALEITGGSSRRGGGVSITNGARAVLEGVSIAKNVSKSGRGGGIAVERGELELISSSISECSAPEGGALFAGEDAKVSLRQVVISKNRAERGGGIALLQGARAELVECKLGGNLASAGAGHQLWIAGSTDKKPVLVLKRVEFAAARAAKGPSIANDPAFPGKIVLEGTSLPEF